MICPKCGKQIPDGSSVCPECLNPLEDLAVRSDAAYAEPAPSMKWY